MGGVKDWLNGFVGTTAGQYLIAMAATWLAAKMGLDPIEGKASIESIIVQIIGLVPAVWGIIQSARNKIVVANKVVSVSKLSMADQEKVVEIVSNATDTPKSELRQQ